MIHGILQFTLRIAFRCVLHRCGCQDITFVPMTDHGLDLQFLLQVSRHRHLTSDNDGTSALRNAALEPALTIHRFVRDDLRQQHISA